MERVWHEGGEGMGEGGVWRGCGTREGRAWGRVEEEGDGR